MQLINPNLGPDPLNRLMKEPTRRRPMARYQVHNVFREMVRAELVRGELPAWRRRRLAHYAASLRLSATEAGELIQEAIRAETAGCRTDARTACLGRPRLHRPATSRRGWPVGVLALIVVGGIIATKLVLSILPTW